MHRSRAGPFGSTIVSPPILDPVPEQVDYHRKYASLEWYGYHDTDRVPKAIAADWATYSGRKIAEPVPFTDQSRVTWREALGLAPFDLPELLPGTTMGLRISEGRAWLNATEMMESLGFPVDVLDEWTPQAHREMAEDGALPPDLWPFQPATFTGSPDQWIDTSLIRYVVTQLVPTGVDETEQYHLALPYASIVPDLFLTDADRRDWEITLLSPPILEPQQPYSPETSHLLYTVAQMPISQDVKTSRAAIDLLLALAKIDERDQEITGCTVGLLCGLDPDQPDQNPMLKPPYVDAPTPLNRAGWHTKKPTQVDSLTRLLKRKNAELLAWLYEFTNFPTVQRTSP